MTLLELKIKIDDAIEKGYGNKEVFIFDCEGSYNTENINITFSKLEDRCYIE